MKSDNKNKKSRFQIKKVLKALEDYSAAVALAEESDGDIAMAYLDWKRDEKMIPLSLFRQEMGESGECQLKISA